MEKLKISLILIMMTLTSAKSYRVMSTVAQTKVDKLRALADKAYPNIPVMHENMKQYEDLILTKPRPYTVVFFSYNSTDARQIKEFEHFREAANQYYNHKAQFTRKKAGRMYRPMFFVALPYDISGGNYEGAKLRDLLGPAAVIISNGEDVNVQNDDDMIKYNTRYIWKIQDTDGVINAERITGYIGDRTGDNMVYNQPMAPFLVMMGILLLAPIILAILHQKLFWVINNVRLWIVVFFLGYFVSTSAQIWSVLNKPSWTGVKDGEPEYINPSMNHQHKAEGLFMGGIICAIPVVMWIFILITKKVHHWLLKRVISYPVAILAIYMIYYLESVVASKRWYNLVWIPADSFTKGTLRENQGHVL